MSLEISFWIFICALLLALADSALFPTVRVLSQPSLVLDSFLSEVSFSTYSCIYLRFRIRPCSDMRAIFLPLIYQRNNFCLLLYYLKFRSKNGLAGFGISTSSLLYLPQLFQLLLNDTNLGDGIIIWFFLTSIEFLSMIIRFFDTRQFIRGAKVIW